MIGKHFFYIAHFFLYCKFFLCDFKFRDMTQQKLLSDLSVHSVITLMLANCANKSRDLAATSNTIQNQSTSKHASSTRIYISHDFTNKPIHTIAGVPSITFVTLHPLVLDTPSSLRLPDCRSPFRPKFLATVAKVAVDLGPEGSCRHCDGHPITVTPVSTVVIITIKSKAQCAGQRRSVM